MQNAGELWTKVCQILKAEMTELGYNTWITGSLRAHALIGKTLLLECIAPVMYEVLMERHGNAIIRAVNAEDRPIAYLLWGRPAQSKMSMLDNPKHKIFTAPHPSPLSAYRGFFGCKHFSQANAFLEANGVEPIDLQIEDV